MRNFAAFEKTLLMVFQVFKEMEMVFGVFIDIGDFLSCSEVFRV